MQTVKKQSQEKDSVNQVDQRGAIPFPTAPPYPFAEVTKTVIEEVKTGTGLLRQPGEVAIIHDTASSSSENDFERKICSEELEKELKEQPIDDDKIINVTERSHQITVLLDRISNQKKSSTQAIPNDFGLNPWEEGDATFNQSSDDDEAHLLRAADFDVY